jgi:MFS family permease
VLACVLALDTADVATIGAVAGKLESALSISNTELGLIAALPSFMSAVATMPIGVLADRVSRTRLITFGIVAWSVAEALSGAATGWVMLLLIRLVVGIGTSTAGPPLASLVGDYFPARDRGRIWGLILTGELIGGGFGFLVAGEVASFASWRWAFIALAVPGIAVAYAVWRWLPEPARGGAGRLQPGATEIIAADRADPGQNSDEFAESEAQEEVEKQGVAPEDQLILHKDPQHMSLWRASVYVLRVRTNLVLIVASALGYFYFQGVQTFGIVLIRGRYGLSHGAATAVLAGIGLAAVVGVVGGGAVADRLLSRGYVNSRIAVGGVAFVAASLLFVPGLLFDNIAPAIAFYAGAGIAFGARNAPLDAARLDVIHHRLWGRAEGVRTLLRRVMSAAAPIAFGAIADRLASGHAVPGAHGFGASASARGLYLTFLILLVTLACGGLLTFVALKTYARDVATALASEHAT